ncbi:D-cysteine desulfhydrase family protein [Ruegeria sp. HKCCD8929]|uniref:D-cysteine desulfhydrase family protein n=1 Tax=Ruegeria sp. HKCCD8929 TaxID=2683006 RepID=UPI001488C7CB|nr:D-cysteine desulfhydrase family protein [Ruegeria sp. HKCCD8929]
MTKDLGTEQFPKARLLANRTPLERLDRLSEHFGLDLWIKRDDLTGLGGGGNKIRQLDYYMGAALADGADTILITGAVQSNYVRSAAAAAARLGMQAILQLEDRVPGMDDTYRTSGNVLLCQILGAEHMFYPEGEDEAGADRALYARAEALRTEGRRPYVIPLGLDAKPLGALGYVDAAREILDQGPEFDAIVVASGSGATHGGLLYGLRRLGSQVPVHGICVRRAAAAQSERLNVVTTKIAALLGQDNPVTPSDILTWDGALAPGYGRMGAQAREAMTLMARMEGLFLDPVYTAKTFAGVPGLLAEGQLRPGSRVLFVHTGGIPALFAYQNDIAV